MIDPECITNFNYSDAELQEFALFTIIVAGKTARTQAKLLDRYLNSLGTGTPFERINRSILDHSFDSQLVASRLGQYKRLAQAFRNILYLDLRTCTLEELEAIHGIGPKTARLFIIHTRPDVRMAAIDVHCLKELRAHGYAAPKATPPAGKRYRELEQAFLELADKSGMSVPEYDLAIFIKYSRLARRDAK